MEFLAISGLLWVVLTISGLPIAVVLLPVCARRSALAIAPLFGYAALALAGYYLYRFDSTGTDRFGLPLVVAIPVCATILAIFSPAVLRSFRACMPDIYCVATIGCGVISLGALAIPFIIIGHGSPISSSLGNLDIQEYACAADVLKNYSRSAALTFPGNGSYLISWADQIWFGVSFLAALTASLFGMETMHTQSLSMNLMAAQGAIATCFVARHLLRIEFTICLLFAVLAGVSPILLYTAWQSFGGQIITVPLLLMGFYFASVCIERGTLASWRNTIRPAVACALMVSAIVVTYHIMYLVFAVLLAGFAVMQIAIQKDWRFTLRSVMILSAILVVALAINPLRVVSLVSTISGFKDIAPAWFIPWLSPDVILSGGGNVISKNPFFELYRAAWIVFAAGSLALGLYGAIISWRKREHGPIAFFLGLFFPVLALGFLYAWRESVDGVLGGYRSYKITSSFLPVMYLAVACVGVGSLTRSTNKVRLACGYFIAFVIACASVFNSIGLVKSFSERAFIPGPEFEALRGIRDLPDIDGVNILETDDPTLMWIDYFLTGIPHAYQRFPYIGRTTNTNPYKYTLSTNAIGSCLQIIPDEARDRVFELGTRFVLFWGKPNENIAISYGTGWWPRTDRYSVSGSMGASCSIYIDNNSTQTTGKLEATFLPLRFNDGIEISVNGRKIGLEITGTSFRSEEFAIKTGRNEVVFKSSLSPTPFSTEDVRLANVSWEKVRLLLTGRQESIEEIPSLLPSQRITASQRSASRFFDKNWHEPEVGWGRWSLASPASVFFNWQGSSDSAVLHLEYRLLLPMPNIRQEIRIDLNGKTLLVSMFAATASNIFQIDVPVPRALLKSNQQNQLSFTCSPILSPSLLGVNVDARKLGVGLHSCYIAQ